MPTTNSNSPPKTEVHYLHCTATCSRTTSRSKPKRPSRGAQGRPGWEVSNASGARGQQHPRHSYLGGWHLSPWKGASPGYLIPPCHSAEQVTCNTVSPGLVRSCYMRPLGLHTQAQIHSCGGWGSCWREWGMGHDCSWVQGFFGGGVLELDIGDSHTTLYRLTPTEFIHFKRVNFMVCEFYLKKMHIGWEKKNSSITVTYTLHDITRGPTLREVSSGVRSWLRHHRLLPDVPRQRKSSLNPVTSRASRACAGSMPASTATCRGDWAPSTSPHLLSPVQS